MTDKTILIKDPDGNIVECEVLGSHLKESFMQKSVPILPPAVAGLMFFLNLCPGVSSGAWNKAHTKVHMKVRNCGDGPY